MWTKGHWSRAQGPSRGLACRCPARPPLKGQVQDIHTKGDPVSRSYRVRIRLDKAEGLMAGMTVGNQPDRVAARQAWLVPSTAVQKGNVWVAQTDGPTNKPFRLALPAPARQKFCLA